MHMDRFAVLLRPLTAAPSRRAALRLLSGLGLAGLVDPAEARKRKKKKKKCAKEGQATSKKRKKCCAGLARDSTGLCAAPIVSPPPPPPTCVPNVCPEDACGDRPDGCGGTLECGGCAGDAICVSGVCQPCTVTCPAGATDCAAALETTMAAGGTVYVCPGLYQGDIDVGKSVTVIGAGEGNDPASNTILKGTGIRSVVLIDSTLVITATFQNLRITGGVGGPGGGISNRDGNILSLIGCTITGNAAEGSGGLGGGIFNYFSRLSLTDCTITGNIAENAGGGIHNFAGRVTLTATTVSGNTGSPTGGGIHTDGGTVTLDAASRVTGNGARPDDPDSGGGIFNSSLFNSGGTVTLADATNVTGNTPDNCGGDPVPLCVD